MKLKEVDFQTMTISEIRKLFDKHGILYRDLYLKLFKKNPKLVMILRKHIDMAGDHAFFATYGNYDTDWELNGRLRIELAPHVLACNRCEYYWFKRNEEEPRVCPNPQCKSPYWNTESKENIGKIIERELEDIPRGLKGSSQNLLRLFYQDLRMNSLGGRWRPLEQKMPKEIFIDSVRAVRRDASEFNPNKKGIFEDIII